MLPELFTPLFLKRLECLRLRIRKEVISSRPGNYSSPRRGTSLEFADYRRYSPGDDIRYLDWGIVARSDRFFVKLYREEVDLFVYLFVDVSGSMAYPSPQEKFVPAYQLALSLAYVVLANHDNIKLHSLQSESEISASPFYHGRHRIMDCVDFFSNRFPQGPLDFTSALGKHLKHIRRPGKVIILSDFLIPPPSYERGLNLLRSLNLDISVIQVLSRPELDPPFPIGNLIVVDTENEAETKVQWTAHSRTEYQERLQHHNRQLKSFCHQAGIDLSLYVTDQKVSEFILQTLPTIGLFK